MRIAFVLGHELPFPPERGGGVNSLLASLCRAFISEGHSVTAYSPLFEGGLGRETDGGITHIRIRGEARRKNDYLNAALGLRYILTIRNVLQPCDVLSCHMLHAFMFSSCKAAKTITYTLHRDPKWFLPLYRGLDRIYTASEAVSVQARLMAPSLAAKVHTVYNCVDFGGYKPPEKRDGNILRFIFVGRFSSDKGVDVLIRAFAAAARRETRIRLSLIGPTKASDGGDERLAEQYRGFIAEAGVSDQIEIVPPIFDRARLDERIIESDVVCLPSVRGETLNMSVIESMRLGKCLLVSDLPANTPLVRQNFNGVFANVGDIQDWTEQILHLAASRDQVAAYGRNAFDYGKETFSTERIALAYLRDFETLLERRRELKPWARIAADFAKPSA